MGIKISRFCKSTARDRKICKQAFGSELSELSGTKISGLRSDVSFSIYIGLKR